MADDVKGLATDPTSQKRFRYQNATDRASAAEAGIARRVRAEHERLEAPERGDAAAFFTDELARWKELDTSEAFQRYARAIAPLSKTLAQLLHHKDAVVSATLNSLRDSTKTGSSAWRSLLALVGVLARDLRHEMMPYYDTTSGVLRGLIDPARPERTAEVFRTLSFLFKYLGGELATPSDAYPGKDGATVYASRFNEWMPYLGSKRLYVREMASASLTMLLRRQQQHQQGAPAGAAAVSVKGQLQSLLRGVASAVPEPSVLAGCSRAGVEARCASASTARAPELRDGVALLAFELLRGVKGGLHSGAPKLLALLLRSAQPKRAKLAELAGAAAPAAAAAASSGGASRKRARADEAAGSSAADSGAADAVTVASHVYQTALALRGEVVAQALRHTRAHLMARPPRGSGGASRYRGGKKGKRSGPADGDNDGDDADAKTGDEAADASGGDSDDSDAEERKSEAQAPRADASATAAGVAAVWEALHEAVEEAAAAWQQLEGQIQSAQAALTAATKASSGTPSGKKAKAAASQAAGSAGASPASSDLASLRASLAELRAYGECLSGYTSHLSGLLLTWLTGGAQPMHSAANAWGGRKCVPIGGLPRLSESLRRLLAPRTWLSPCASPLQRFLTLQLLTASWPLLLAPPTSSFAPHSAGGKGKGGNNRGDGKGKGGGDKVAAEAALAAEAAIRAARRLVENVFAADEETPCSGAPPAAEALLAASFGVLMPRAAHVAESAAGLPGLYLLPCVSESPLRQVLGTARDLLRLAAGWVRGGHASGPSTLSLLLPPLASYLQPLALAPGGSGRATVWSLLLDVRDAVSPGGDGSASLASLLADVPGLLTRSGRLVMDGSAEEAEEAESDENDEEEEGGAGAKATRAAAVPASSALTTSLPSILLAHLTALPEALGAGAAASHLPTLSGALEAVSATAALVLPPKPAVAALLGVFAAPALAAPLAGRGLPSDSSPSAGVLRHHIRASALLNASRLAGEGREAAARVGGGGADALAPLADPAAFAGVSAWVRECVAFAEAARPYAPALSAEAAAEASASSAARDALLLAALNAASVYCEALRAAVTSAADSCGALLSVTAGNTLAVPLLPVLAHCDHSLRLCALRLLACFDAPHYLPKGAHVPTTVQVLAEDQPASPSSVPAGKDKGAAKRRAGAPPATSAGPVATEPVHVLLEESLTAESDSSVYEGPSSVIRSLLRMEALPVTLMTERARISGVAALGPALGSRRLPPLHVAALLHCMAGALYTRFSPLWPAVTALLAGPAAASYPATLWAVLGRQLFVAAVDRPAAAALTEDDSAPAAEDDAATVFTAATRASRATSRIGGGSSAYAAVTGRTRSQGRNDRLQAKASHLRLAALAVKALVEEGEAAEDEEGDAGSADGGDASMGGSVAGAGEGALGASAGPTAPGLISRRCADVLSHGVTGADAGTPALVAAATASTAPSAPLQRVGAGGDDGDLTITFSHANDVIPLGLGEGGRTDSETVHKTLLAALAAAPTWAEGRSRALVPLFLSLLRDDFYGPGAPHAEDPDGHELRLGAGVRALHAKHVALERRAREKKALRDAKAAGGAGGSGSLMGAAAPGAGEVATPVRSALPDSDAILQRLVDREAHVTSAAPEDRVSLTGPAVSARVLSYLGLFATFRGWDGVFGRGLLHAALLRLLTKMDGGLAEGSLKVLLATKAPSLLPYRDSLLRLLRDDAYRDEMATFTLSASAPHCAVAQEHRPGLLSVLLRLMYGRITQRKGGNKRDSPAARRATVLSYVAALAPGELSSLVYLAMRPFLLPFGAPVAAAASNAEGAVEGDSGFDAGAALVRGIARPTDEAGARALAATVRRSFAPATGAVVLPESDDSDGCPRYVTAARSLGLLHLLHDLVRQVGTKLTSHLHVVLGVVAALLHETRVQEEAHAAAGNDDASEAGGDESDLPEVLSIATRAREVRTLAVLRLTDIITAYPDYPHYGVWLPLLRDSLSAAVPQLPAAMAHAGKPSALLLLFSAAAADTRLHPFLTCAPSIIPAAMACLSAGMPGSAAAFAAHLAATMGAPSGGKGALLIDADTVTQRGPGDSNPDGPSGPVLAVAFAIVERLLGIDPDEPQKDSDSPGSALPPGMAAHVPHLLRHFTLRLAAAVETSSSGRGGASSSACPGPDDVIVVPRLKGGLRAFSRRQLAVLGRLAQYAGPDAGESAWHGRTVQQLVWLLLPYLRVRGGARGRPGSSESGGDDPVLLVLRTIRRLAPQLPAPQPYLPFFSSLLAPGPRALAGASRASALSVLSALGSHASLAPLRPGLALLVSLGAAHPKRLGELDYDAVTRGLETLMSRDSVSSLFAPATAALAPALLHQTAHLMHDSDLACRSGALNALSAVVRHAASLAVAHWQSERDGYAAPPPSASPEPAEVEVPEHLGCAGFASSAPHELALYAVIRIVVPDARSSMATVSPALRRACITLLADVVREFQPYGTLAQQAIAAGGEEAAPSGPVRAVGHPNLHSDLGILINDSDPEQDGFANLTHVQVHRRARALLKLASLVEARSIGTFSIRSFVLPLTLHALHDEAAGAGGGTIEVKGKIVKLSAAASSGYIGGLHAEAVRLIGAVAGVLPWGVYQTTLRSLLRQVARTPSLEKVLLRAVAAMVEAFPFSLAPALLPPAQEAVAPQAPPAPGARPAPAPIVLLPGGLLPEREFLGELMTTLDTNGRRSTPVFRPGAPGPADPEKPEPEAESDKRKGPQGQKGGRKGDADSSAAAAAAADGKGKAKAKGRKRGAGEEDEEEGGEAGDAAEALRELDAVAEGGDGTGEEEAADAPDGEAGEGEGDDDASTVASTVGDRDAPPVEDDSDDSDPAVAAELQRRSIMVALASSVVPSLARLLFRKVDPKGGKHMGAQNEEGELRAPVAVSLVRLLRLMPASVLHTKLPGLLARMMTALRSRDQDFRDSARGTIARVAVLLGPSSLPLLVGEMRAALTEGYAVHVLGHAVHAVVEALAPSMVPSAPVIPENSRALRRALPSAVDNDDDNDNDGPDAASPSAAPSLSEGSLSLVESLPSLMEVILDDLLTGEAAETRREESGYKPKNPVREAKHSRSPDTLETVARCVPFLPHGAIHSVTAPLIVALEDGRRAGKPVEVVIEGLFRRLLAGLGRNPSVTGPYALLYVHGICADFLHISAPAAAAALLKREQQQQQNEAEEQEGKGGKDAPTSSSSAASAAPVWAVGGFDPATALQAWIAPKGASRLKPVAQWIIKDERAAKAPSSAPSSASSAAASAGTLSAAMQLKGSGISSRPVDAYNVLPAPRMTGAGRYALLDKAGTNSGSSSAADVPMGSFALSLLQACLRAGRVTSKHKLHCAMLDPFIPLLLRLAGGATRDSRVLGHALRLLVALLPYPLPSTRKLGKQLGAAVFSCVQAHAGGGSANNAQTARSELATLALKAAATLLRTCDFVKVTDDQLRALLAIVRADLPVAVRQTAVYGLLRAILSRRFLAPEVYDLMEDVGRQLVTSLRPNARSLCAGAFLSFLLKYPMTEGRLQGHLDFFVRNLGYPLPGGRIAALDMLHALVTKLPQPLADEYAEYLLLPLTVRLAGDPEPAVRAGVGALVKTLFRSVTPRKAAGLVALCLKWLAPEAKPGLRRVAAQVVGLAVEARPEAVTGDASGKGSSGSGGTLGAILSALTSELRRAHSDMALAQAALAAAAAASREDDGNGGGDDGEEEDAADGGEGDEEAERREGARADARSGRIASGSGEGVYGEGDDDDEEEGEEAPAPAFPVGSSGGGAEVFGQPSAAASSRKQDGPSKPSSSSSSPSRGALLAPLLWEPAYYALLAAEKLWRHVPDRVEAALAAAGTTHVAAAAAAGGASLKGGKRRRLGSDASEASAAAPEAADDESDEEGGERDGAAAPSQPLAPHASPADVPAAACDLLLFPHAWVRLASCRLLGAFLARRSLDDFAPPPPTAAAAAASPSSPPRVGSWLVREEALYALASRLASQLASRAAGPALVEQASRNLLFAALALHRCVPTHRRNGVHPLLQPAEGEATDAEAQAPVEGAEADDTSAALDADVDVDGGMDEEADEGEEHGGDEDAAEGVDAQSEGEASAAGSDEDEDDEDEEDAGEADEAVEPAAAAEVLDEEEDAQESDGDDDDAVVPLASAGLTAALDPLYRLVDRLCRVASRASNGPAPTADNPAAAAAGTPGGGDASRPAILRLLAALFVKLAPEEGRRYAMPVVRLLYRVTSVDDSDRSGASGSTRALATEALELLQARLGSAAVLRSLNAERARVASLRLQRRRERALAKVLDPASAAAAKEKRQRAKLRQRRRKVDAFRTAKGKRAGGDRDAPRGDGGDKPERSGGGDRPERRGPGGGSRGGPGGRGRGGGGRGRGGGGRGGGGGGRGGGGGGRGRGGGGGGRGGGGNRSQGHAGAKRKSRG